MKVKVFTAAFLVFLIWAAFGMFWHVCINKGLCFDARETVPLYRASSDSIPSEGRFLFFDVLSEIKGTSGRFQRLGMTAGGLPGSMTRFSVRRNSDTVFFFEDAVLTKTAIYDYMETHRDKEIFIIGRYGPFESPAGSFINWGLTRALFLKNILVEFGLNADRIVIGDMKWDMDFDVDNRCDMGVTVGFRAVSSKRLENIEKGVLTKTFYLNFGEEDLTSDKGLRTYALELKNYLQKYDGKKVYVEGHTDNVGEASVNKWIGLQRAWNLKKYFVSMGIPETLIIVSSKGEEQPLMENTSRKGRQKNRRIELLVK